MRRYPTVESWIESEDLWRRLTGVLRKFQKENDLSRQEMADRLGVHIGTYAKYLSYNSNWTASAMLNVMNCVGVKMKDLTKNTQYEEIH